MRAGMAGLQSNVTTVSGYLDPLRGFVVVDTALPGQPDLLRRAADSAPVDDVVAQFRPADQRRDKLTGGSADRH